MPSLKHTLFSVLCLFIFNFSAYALPLGDRQVDGSQTLETVTTEMTPDGPVTANCTIVLTPVTDGNGQMAVQEVKTCNLVLNPGPSQPTASTAPVETSSHNSPTTKSSTESTADSITSNATPTATVSTTTSAAPSGGSGAISAHPASTVTVSSSSGPTSSSPSKGTVSAQPVPTVTANTATSISSPTSTGPPPGTTTATSVGNTSSASSTTAAAANASDVSSTTTAPSGNASGTTTAAESSNAAISLPGKKLSVLPIGLGVFAGISVIALIVVGLVTYERRKYRKAFRQRKLAESGAAMGYGGMAQ